MNKTSFSYWIRPNKKIKAIVDVYSGLTRFCLGPFWTWNEARQFLIKWEGGK